MPNPPVNFSDEINVFKFVFEVIPRLLIRAEARDLARALNQIGIGFPQDDAAVQIAYVNDRFQSLYEVLRQGNAGEVNQGGPGHHLLGGQVKMLEKFLAYPGQFNNSLSAFGNRFVTAVAYIKAMSGVSNPIRGLSETELAALISPTWEDLVEETMVRAFDAALIECVPQMPRQPIELTLDSAVRQLTPWLLRFCWGKNLDAIDLERLEPMTTPEAIRSAEKVAVERLYSRRFPLSAQFDEGFDDWPSRRKQLYYFSHMGKQLERMLQAFPKDLPTEAREMVNKALRYGHRQALRPAAETIFNAYFGIRAVDLSKQRFVRTIPNNQFAPQDLGRPRPNGTPILAIERVA